MFLVPGLVALFVIIVELVLVFILQFVFHGSYGGFAKFVSVGISAIMTILLLPWYLAILLEQYQDLKLRSKRKLDMLLENLNKRQPFEA